MKKRLVLKKKYFIILASLFFIGLFILIMALSYAFFTSTVASKDFVIYTGNLSVNYEKNTDVINLENAYPMTNEEGLLLTPHEFLVRNIGNITARYQVRLELDNTINDLISPEYIKLSYKIDDNDYSTPVLLSDLGSSLVFVSDIILSPTASNNFGIKLWVDINVSNNIQGKIFKAKVVVDSIQNVDAGYVFDTAPIIYLNKDNNGNYDSILKTGSIYTDPGINRVEDDKDIINVSEVNTTYQFYDGNNIIAVNDIDTSKVGIYYINYSVTDSDNNIGKTTRTIAVNDNNSLEIYSDINATVNSFDVNSLKEVVMCSYIDVNSRLYFDCKIHETIEAALNSKTKGIIIMTSNIERDTANIFIGAEQDIVLELYGKNITASKGYPMINYGNVVINDSVGTGGINSGGQSLNNSGIGTLTVNGGTYIRNGTGSTVFNQGNGTILINNGVFRNEGTGYCVQNGLSDLSLTGIIQINDGNFSSSNTTIKNYSGPIYLNNGIYNSITNEAIRNDNPIYSINIYGGIYISQEYRTINNTSTGSINIVQTNNPIYMSSLAKIWRPVVVNDSGGSINIEANQANACTSNVNDTTSGLCVYAEGNGQTINDSGNGAIRNGGTGITNIYGGTYYGGYQGLNNGVSGILNVANAKVSSGWISVLNNSTGTINVCDSVLNGGTGDFYNTTTGTINYSSNVVFTNGTNIPNIYRNPTGTISGNYTDTCIIR